MSDISDDPMRGLSSKKKKKIAKGKLVKSFDQTVYGQILYQIPRHLLKITIIAVLGSFIGMFYIINSDKSLEDFIYAQEIYDFTQNKLHPLFAHMQRDLDPEVKSMISQIKN